MQASLPVVTVSAPDAPQLEDGAGGPLPAAFMKGPQPLLQPDIPLCIPPRNGGLAQSHQGLSLKGTKLWLRGCGLLCNFIDTFFFLLFIFVVNGDFKAKTYLLSSINSL